MNLLIDTHILIWWLRDDSTLSQSEIDIIANPNNLIVVSAAAAWEIAITSSSP